MSHTKVDRDEKLNKTLDLFWHTIPPIWHMTRTMTHIIASKEFDITPSKFHTMRRILDGKNSISQLADCLLLSRPNISRTVDKLVQEGLIERYPDLSDRRVVKIALTAKGKLLYKKMHQRIHDDMKFFFSQLTEDELSTVIKSLSIMEKLLVQPEKMKKENEKII